jgi:hypothetical protein
MGLNKDNPTNVFVVTDTWPGLTFSWNSSACNVSLFLTYLNPQTYFPETGGRTSLVAVLLHDAATHTDTCYDVIPQTEQGPPKFAHENNNRSFHALMAACFLRGGGGFTPCRKGFFPTFRKKVVSVFSVIEYISVIGLKGKRPGQALRAPGGWRSLNFYTRW